MDVRDMIRVTVDEVTPPPTEELTRRVRTGLRRRRILRTAIGSTAAVAVLGAAGLGGVHLAGRQAPTPRADGTRASLPARSLGTAVYLTPRCDGSDCRPALQTNAGTYRLPGPRLLTPKRVTGAALSPDAKWVAYNDGKQVVARDVGTDRVVRVPDSGNLGVPEAWSADGHWLVVRKGWDENGGTGHGMSFSSILTRVDLRTGRSVRFDPATVLPDIGHELWQANGVLPSGELVFGRAVAPQATPVVGAPARPAAVLYRMVDPVRRAVTRQVTVDALVRATVTGAKTPSWLAGPAPALATAPDGRQAAFIGDPDGEPVLGTVDLTTGVARTVAPLPWLRHADKGLAKVDRLVVAGYDSGRIVIGLYQGSALIGTAEFAPGSATPTVLQRSHYPDGTLLPGMMPPLM